MISYKVSDVKIAVEPVEEMPVKKAIQFTLKKEVESCSNFSESIIPAPYHALVHASHMAYGGHRPLVLSPDILWLTIAQGLSNHVNSNAELLRKKFVNFEGKQKIKVLNNVLRKGVLENPWPDVFEQFSKEIMNRIGRDNHKNIVQTFTTTGLVEKAANELVLMDAMKSYFDYCVRTLCGIPEVILEGTAEDYALIKEKAENIGNEYGMEWWMEKLLPVLTRIADVAAGQEDTDLWENWYKVSGGSGGPYISGHITNFFPYLKNWREGNKCSKRNEFNERGHITSDEFPSSLCQVPFVWEYFDQVFNMFFISGFVGITQDKKTMAVRPKIGWAVMDKDAPNDTNYFRICEVCKKEQPWQEIVGARETLEDSDYKKPICRNCYYNLSGEKKRKEFYEDSR
jgi:hypothetical protein